MAKNHYEIIREKNKSVLGPSPKDRICWWVVVATDSVELEFYVYSSSHLEPTSFG